MKFFFKILNEYKKGKKIQINKMKEEKVERKEKSEKKKKS